MDVAILREKVPYEDGKKEKLEGKTMCVDLMLAWTAVA